mmetsp:Transcript_21267/g.54460  ORF Transcript_21267/g.54460 Transcript_21267/m.54460 type:complete len:344 (+) Transcript_21267:1621-2652(+)
MRKRRVGEEAGSGGASACLHALVIAPKPVKRASAIAWRLAAPQRLKSRVTKSTNARRCGMARLRVWASCLTRGSSLGTSAERMAPGSASRSFCTSAQTWCGLCARGRPGSLPCDTRAGSPAGDSLHLAVRRGGVLVTGAWLGDATRLFEGVPAIAAKLCLRKERRSERRSERRPERRTGTIGVRLGRHRRRNMRTPASRVLTATSPAAAARAVTVVESRAPVVRPCEAGSETADVESDVLADVIAGGASSRSTLTPNATERAAVEVARAVSVLSAAERTLSSGAAMVVLTRMLAGLTTSEIASEVTPSSCCARLALYAEALNDHTSPARMTVNEMVGMPCPCA